MDWRPPESFGSLPPAAWPVEAIGYAFALSGDDWGKIVMTVVGSSGAVALAIAGAWAKVKAAYDASNAAKLKEAQKQIAANTVRIEEIEAERDAYKTEWKTVKAENDSLREKLVERDRTIAERDAAIRLRDQAIQEHMRVTGRLGADVADLAEAYLILKGDVKPRAK